MDVGEFPQYSDADGEAPDPQRPVRLLAHAVARTADRIGPLRKLNRHLEGTESRAGIASDLVAEAYELYARNADQFEALARQYFAGVSQRGAQRRAAREANPGRNGRTFRRRESQQTPSTAEVQ